MSELVPPLSPASKQLQLGVYKHYTGIQVRALGVARHSETLEEVVMYVHLDDGNVWVRPVTMFCSNVEHQGVQQPRFLFLHA
jgi:hypothetical protein